jgi:hypothetical protein
MGFAGNPAVGEIFLVPKSAPKLAVEILISSQTSAEAGPGGRQPLAVAFLTRDSEHNAAMPTREERQAGRVRSSSSKMA